MLPKLSYKSQSSRQLKRVLVAGSAFGIFTISTLVALVSCVPLIQQLRDGENRNLRFALQTRELATEEFLNRAHGISQQIVSRTKARQVLEQYLDGEISYDDLVRFSHQALGDALENADDVASIVRFADDGKVAAELGIPIPPELLDLRAAASETSVIRGPVEIDGAQYFLIYARLYTDQRVQIGTDVLAFQVSSLQTLVEDYVGLGQTGEMVLAQEIEGNLALLFPLRDGSAPSQALTDSLYRSLRAPHNSSVASPKVISDSEIIFHRNVDGADWGMAIKMDRQELYAPVNRQIRLTALATLLLSSAGTAGLLLLFRPLLRRVTDVEELQAQIEQKEDALNQLQRAQTQLIQSEKMSGLGQMVAGIAHEINNPVSFIHGNLKAAQNYGDDLINLLRQYQQDYPRPSETIQEIADDIDLDFIQEDYPKIFASMYTGTSRIRDIVKSLRTFSRLDESALKTVDVNEGLDSVLLLLQSRCESQAGQPEIKFLRCYGDLPKVECYPNQLNQACFNILTNAIDALQRSKQSGGQIRISTEPYGKDAIKILIADNGPGIDPTVQSKIFNPFFTTKKVGEGTGMGLAVSYNIVVDEHGGKLTCESEPGKGCNFVITIPILQQSQRSTELAIA
ncbi:MAG: ATP-binding protein [Cyanobacteria bacterium J06626_23]